MDFLILMVFNCSCEGSTVSFSCYSKNTLFFTFLPKTFLFCVLLFNSVSTLTMFFSILVVSFVSVLSYECCFPFSMPLIIIKWTFVAYELFMVLLINEFALCNHTLIKFPWTTISIWKCNLPTFVPQAIFKISCILISTWPCINALFSVENSIFMISP